MPEAIYTARPLTDEEKIFAEKNHNLMYRYIRIHELDKSMGISVKKYNQILDRLIKAVEEVMYDV